MITPEINSKSVDRLILGGETINCIDVILDYLNNPSQYFDQFTLQTDEETLTKMYSDFYGDTMSQIILNCKSTKIEVANDMGWGDFRILSYILSRNDLKHRNIKFFEALRFSVATNLSISDCLAFLNICNYSLCFNRLRDRIIYIILSASSHHSKLEMDARLDCLGALEDNEPWNTDDYDYFTLFSYVRRKREGVM